MCISFSTAWRTAVMPPKRDCNRAKSKFMPLLPIIHTNIVNKSGLPKKHTSTIAVLISCFWGKMDNHCLASGKAEPDASTLVLLTFNWRTPRWKLYTAACK